MTCPCEDMKILQHQQDFDGLLNGSWTAQSPHGLGIFQGIQVQGVWVHPRPFPAHAPGWGCCFGCTSACVWEPGEMFLHRFVHKSQLQHLR